MNCKSTLIRFIVILGVVTIVLTACEGDSWGPGGTNECDTAKRVAQLTPAKGPLTVDPCNSRYFTDGSGKAIYLTGSHSWANFQELGVAGTPHFDYNFYLDFLEQQNHNFFRLWVWEQATWLPTTKDKVLVDPLPYLRTGPGVARDGKLKFDLTKFNEAYFNRLRSRVIAARDRGIYVAVMLFQGWSIEDRGLTGNPWDGHPFRRDNNINGIDGDPNGDWQGKEAHTLQIPAITTLQEAYIRKVIDTLNDLDNVLWEISNESQRESVAWHYHMINHIKAYEAAKPKQHPVGITSVANNRALFASPAEWISVDKMDGNRYRLDPPAASGEKVSILDSDHIAPLDDHSVWAFKAFTRGHNPIYMDVIQPWPGEEIVPDPTWNVFDHPDKWRVRQQLGYTRSYAERINLARMVPRKDLSSTRYALANPGSEYLVYQPKSNRPFTVNLAPGAYSYEWFNPTTGTVAEAGIITSGGGNHSFNAPFSGDAVLYLFSSKNVR